jgi:hypothetical protein
MLSRTVNRTASRPTAPHRPSVASSTEVRLKVLQATQAALEFRLASCRHRKKPPLPAMRILRDSTASTSAVFCLGLGGIGQYRRAGCIPERA